MFHLADPDEPGLGVTILTPGLTRSSQPVMCLGFPLRTTRTTTDWVSTPWFQPEFQFCGTTPAWTRFVTSGSRDRCTSSAFSPAATARLWSPDAPYDVVNCTPLPAGVLWKSLKTLALAVWSTENPTTLTV